MRDLARGGLRLAALLLVLAPSSAGAVGQHGDPCPTNCQLRSMQCRSGCKKSPQKKLCFERCAVDKELCPDMCRAVYALALDPNDAEKQKKMAALRVKRNAALQKINEKEAKEQRRKEGKKW